MGKIKLKAQEQNMFNLGGKQMTSKGYILRPVRYNTMRSKDVVEQCVKSSMVPKAYVNATMTALSDCIINYLFNGHSVEFPNLGIFYLTCESTSTTESEEAGLQQLADFRIRFRPCKELKTELEKVEYELDGVYEVIGERVLERDADGKPIRTEKIYSKVRGGEDELLIDDDTAPDGGNTTEPDSGGNSGSGNNPDSGGFEG